MNLKLNAIHLMNSGKMNSIHCHAFSFDEDEKFLASQRISSKTGRTLS
jgi:hypothetical protein